MKLERKSGKELNTEKSKLHGRIFSYKNLIAALLPNLFKQKFTTQLYTGFHSGSPNVQIC